MRQDLKLAEAINVIKSTETILPVRSFTAIAAVAVVSTLQQGRGGRGRGRGGRGRGRGQGAGENNTNSRDTSLNRDQSKVVKVQGGCFFCLKKGHLQSVCRAYKASRDSYQKNLDSNDTAQAQVAVASQYTYGNSCSGADIRTPLLSDVTALSSSDFTAVASFVHTADPADRWVLDSGASQHFSGVLADFETLKRWREPKTVTIANGTTVQALGQSLIQLEQLQLQEAWYVPDFGTTRLISVSRLGKQGYELSAKDDVALILRNQTLICQFKTKGGIYHLKLGLEDAAFIHTASALTKSEQYLWHRRLAYINIKYLDKLRTAAEGVSYRPPKTVQPGDQACEGCLAGKMKESFNKTTDNRSGIKLRRLHADISGILHPSFRNYRYFLVIVDDAT